MTLQQVNLVSAGVALAWLCASILYGRLNRPKETYQLRRVPRAAFAFMAGHALILLTMAVLFGGPGVVEFHIMLINLILIGMAAFLSVLLIDVAGILLGGRRTPLWLVAGIFLATFITYGWLHMLAGGLWGSGPDPRSLAIFPPGLIAAAAAVIWWSELPRPEEDESGIFD